MNRSVLYEEPTSSSVGNEQPERGSNLTIIVIGCDRPDGMLRALNSTKEANVPLGAALHICVDACGKPEVGRIAKEFEWPYGPKQITLRKTRLGLAEHITNCWENPLPDQWALFVEDDVILAPHAFSAFSKALTIRNKHDYAANIVGIALHDSRVNEYCWKQRMHSMRCPKIQKLCKTVTASYSSVGSLMCLKRYSDGSWILNQIPSSWGGFYEGQAWNIFKKYFASRSRLTLGESLVLNIPHSFSNEWEKSWKRYYMELMFNAGWTFMYLSHRDQIGFATSTSSDGVHSAMTESEEEKRCLINLPLSNSLSFMTDKNLVDDANKINSFDYCAGKTSVSELRRQGAASTKSLSKYYNSRDTYNHTVGYHSNQSGLLQTLVVLQQANTMGMRQRDAVLYEGQNNILSTGYDVTFLEKAEIFILTTCKAVDESCKRAARHFQTFEGFVHFIVVASGKVCQKLFRGNIHVTCVNDILFHPKVEESPRLPMVSELLQVVKDSARPNAKWLGIMNVDVEFDGTLHETLRSISKSEACQMNDAERRCVVTGQRAHVDGKTRRKQLDSDYGTDFFIFNHAALDFLLPNKLLPPFTVGQIQWADWSMYFLSSNDEIKTIDASREIEALHFMTFHEASSSNASGMLPSINATFYATKQKNKQLRYEFDELIEENTNYRYLEGARPARGIPGVSIIC